MDLQLVSCFLWNYFFLKIAYIFTHQHHIVVSLMPPLTRRLWDIAIGPLSDITEVGAGKHANTVTDNYLASRSSWRAGVAPDPCSTWTSLAGWAPVCFVI